MLGQKDIDDIIEAFNTLINIYEPIDALKITLDAFNATKIAESRSPNAVGLAMKEILNRLK